MESDEAEKFRELMENYYPDYGHDEECTEGCRLHWTWQDWGIPEEFNPLKIFITPYLQISRADSMKGSEQVVRGFAGFRPPEFDSLGNPNLMPKQGQNGTTVIVQNGQRAVGEVRKGWRGLMGK